jgi:DNA sulfur modification protein DndE
MAVVAGVACVAALVLGWAAWGSTRTASAQGGRKSKYTRAQAKALDEWSYALALDAATYGSPAVIMYLLRYNDAVGPKPLAPPNRIWRMPNISTPELAEKSGYVLPNCSTIYGFGFLDLRQEPVVMTLPDSQGRYYMVETVDMWTNAFAYPAGVVAGYKGGKVAYVGPKWKGKLPEGVKRIDCPTPWILIQPRIHLPDPSELDAARAVLAGIKTQGLAEFTGQPAPPAPSYKYVTPQRKNPKQPVSVMDFVDPLQFWEIMSAVMNENPPPAAEVKAVLPMFKPLGIELGKQWDRSKVDPIVLKAMARAAENIPTMLADLPFGRLSNGWMIPPPTIGDPKTDYKIRAIIARIGLTANAPKEAIYFAGTALVDTEGNPLTGAKKYTMTFQKTPPYIKPGFWQLRMFDGTNSYPVPNLINRYFIGSDTKGMKYNRDGSLTIYIQADSPGRDKEANWLPAPKGPIILILAAYAPGEAFIESLSNPKAYVPPPAVAVQ